MGLVHAICFCVIIFMVWDIWSVVMSNGEVVLSLFVAAVLTFVLGGMLVTFLLRISKKQEKLKFNLDDKIGR